MLSPELSSLEGHEGEHLLALEEEQMLVRYLKVDMKGSETNDNGLYCTITRIKVFGSSMHQVMSAISMDLFSSNSVSVPTEDLIMIEDIGQ